MRPRVLAPFTAEAAFSLSRSFTAASRSELCGPALKTGRIAALAKAAELAFADREKDLERLEEFKEKLISCCKACGGAVNGPAEALLPLYPEHFLPRVLAEVLLHSLDAKGISVSTGSACSSRQKTPSHVLSAMGLDREPNQKCHPYEPVSPYRKRRN